MYKVFITLHLASISIKIPLFTLSKYTPAINGSVFLHEQTAEAVHSKKTKNLIPIIYPDSKIINYEPLTSKKVAAMIVVDNTKALRANLPVFNMRLADFRFLQRTIKTPNETGSINNPTNVTIRKNDDFETLSLIIQIFLQLPPILTVIFVIILYKAFVDENEDSGSFYRYEDVGMSTYRMRANNMTSMCSICYEEFGGDDMIRILECEHCFHKNCIGLWLNRSNYCPMCRKNIYRGSLVSFGDIVYI